jgi:hypothetical protein
VVESNGTFASLTREQRLAALLVDRLGLAPPVDVASVAAHVADVETDLIPGSCDGVVVGLSGGRPRPLIVVDRAAPPRRRRFTLAHEIGHITLPWHIGTAACDTGLRVRDPPEIEANRFAAELLVPSAWLVPIVADLGSDTIAPLLDALRVCEISIHVACLRLSSVLPPGWIFVLPGEDGTVDVSARSAGTIPTPPRPGSRFDASRFRSFATSVERLSFGGRSSYWFGFGASAVPDTADDPRDWRTVLRDLSRRHTADEASAKKLAHSISSIVGYAHGVALRNPPVSPEKLLGHIRSRFAGREDLPVALLDDPDFPVYLAKKSEDLSRRRS